jgi:hypothetical protein
MPPILASKGQGGTRMCVSQFVALIVAVSFATLPVFGQSTEIRPQIWRDRGDIALLWMRTTTFRKFGLKE